MQSKIAKRKSQYLLKIYEKKTINYDTWPYPLDENPRIVNLMFLAFTLLQEKHAKLLQRKAKKQRQILTWWC